MRLDFPRGYKWTADRPNGIGQLVQSNADRSLSITFKTVSWELRTHKYKFCQPLVPTIHSANIQILQKLKLKAKLSDANSFKFVCFTRKVNRINYLAWIWDWLKTCKFSGSLPPLNPRNWEIFKIYMYCQTLKNFKIR